MKKWFRLGRSGILPHRVMWHLYAVSDLRNLGVYPKHVDILISSRVELEVCSSLGIARICCCCAFCQT